MQRGSAAALSVSVGFAIFWAAAPAAAFHHCPLYVYSLMAETEEPTALNELLRDDVAGQEVVVTGGTVSCRVSHLTDMELPKLIAPGATHIEVRLFEMSFPGVHIVPLELDGLGFDGTIVPLDDKWCEGSGSYFFATGWIPVPGPADAGDLVLTAHTPAGDVVDHYVRLG